jgi:hypothetical protein
VIRTDAAVIAAIAFIYEVPANDALHQLRCTGFAYGEYLSFASPKERTKEKAPPDRSKSRNKINSLRQMRKLAIC